MKFTEAFLKKLKDEGKIRDYTIVKNKKSTTVTIRPGGKTKEWIQLHLQAWAGANHLDLKKEHRFHPERRWRFDWALPDKMIGIEYEGLNSEKSGHTTISG